MKKLLIAIAAVILSGNMIAQGESILVVPQPVTKAFSAQFPAARLKKWEQRKEGYIASFRQDGKKYFAYYSADGSWKGTEAPIKWTKNLPDSVKAGWKTSGYYNWYVEDIKRIETPEQPLYVLHVNNGSLLDSDHHDAFKEEYLLFFSPKGDLVRKEKMP
jgi:hypothetical protein